MTHPVPQPGDNYAGQEPTGSTGRVSGCDTNERLRASVSDMAPVLRGHSEGGLPGTMSPTKRLRPRAHSRARKDTKRLSLTPLTFEEAVKGALATKSTKNVEQDAEREDTANGDSS